jgi:hypothetical protein
MNKYKIEGGIDFFNELYKSLDDETDQSNENNICLITNQPLTDKFIALKCGHKFNYIPLYNDLVNHKGKFNYMEGTSGKLGINEIRCPYCRSKEEGVLPYYEELGLKQVPGVNIISTQPTSTIYKHNTCEYLIPNLTFDPSSNNIIEVGTSLDLYNCKFYKCHYNYTSQLDESYGDKKYYCWQHKKVVVKQYKKEAIEKVKQQKLEAKKQAKNAKEEAKLLEKEAKKKAKEEQKNMILEEKMKKLNKKQKPLKNLINEIQSNTEEENVIIHPNISVTDNTQFCSQILKTGLKAGDACGLNMFKDNLCKRHYNLKNKE